MKVSIAFLLARITVERVMDITGCLVDGGKMHLKIGALRRADKAINAVKLWSRVAEGHWASTVSMRVPSW